MKQPLLFILIIIGLCSYTSHGQDYSWSIKATGNSQRYKDVDLNVDIQGNMVVAGYYQGNFSMGNLSLHTDDDYYADIYLTRINANKEVEWLRHIEAGNDFGENIALTVDDDDNIYITGGKGGYIFVAKYDALGNELWSTNFQDMHYGNGKSIAVDQFDNVYVSGGSGWNFFMAKLDFSGETLWVKDLWHNYSQACNVNDIAVDALGNIYFVGVFSIAELVLDQFTLLNDSGNSRDTFWGKMDPDGTFVWLKSAIGKTGYAPQIALTSDNKLYLSGSLYSGITFDTVTLEGICCQNPKPFIAKYDTAGLLIWAKDAQTTYQQRGVPADIKTDYMGNLYLTGSYFTVLGETSNDSYVEKYSPEGTHQWRKEFKMESDDYAKAIEMDNNGFCYFAGYNRSTNFIDETQISIANTTGIAQWNTLTSTYKKTERPKINHEQFVCTGDNLITLTAVGTNVKWYTDAALNNQIHGGDSYSFSIGQYPELFVTQTINNIESWPKQVFIRNTTLPSAVLTFENNILMATYDSSFQYQWWYQHNSIAGQTSHFITVESGSLYTDYDVEITQGNCSVQLNGESLSIKTSSANNFLYVYPNPTADILYLQNVENSAFHTNSITITDLHGLLILKKEFPNGLTIEHVDFSRFAKGLYLLKASSDNGTQTFKVLKK